MIEKTPCASSVIKRRCLCVVLVAALFVILADVGITALLLYYVNLSKVCTNDFIIQGSIKGSFVIYRNSYILPFYLLSTSIQSEKYNSIINKPL